MIFSLNYNVFAIGTAGDSSSVPTSTGGPSEAKNNVPYVSNSWFRGVRFTFVDQNGNPISRSYDYSFVDITNTAYKTTIFAPKYKYSKTQYINNPALKDAITFVPTNTSSLFSDVNTLITRLNRYNFKSDYNWRGQPYDLSFIAEMFYRHNYKGSNYEQDLIGFLKHYVSDEWLTDEKIKNVFLVFEPLAVVKLNEQGYYGTAYEVTLMAASTPNSELLGKDVGFNCSNGTANCDIGSFTRLTYLCSTFIDGSLSSKVPFESFTSTSYFNNVSIMNPSTVASKCTSNSKFNYSDIVDNYGIGMGVVWFSDLFDPGDPNCELIDRTAKNVGGLSYNTPVDSTNISLIQSIVNAYNNNVPTGYKTTSTNYYKANCTNSPTGGPYDCTPKYGVGSCSSNDSSIAVSYIDSGENGSIDNEYWNSCVFNDNGSYIGMGDNHKYSTTSRDTTYFENELGNSTYCPVYCIETLSANFDKSTVTVKAGQNFVWPSSAYVNGSRTCRTKEVDWDAFKTNLNSANNEVLEAYKQLLIEKKIKAELDNGTTTIANSTNCDCKNNQGGIACCKETETGPTGEECGVLVSGPNYDQIISNDCEGKNVDGTYVTRYVDHPDGTRTNYHDIVGTTCKTYDYERYTFNKGETGTIYLTIGNSTSALTWSYLGWCSNGTKPTADVTGKENNYNTKVGTVNALINEMKSCYEWNADNIYRVGSSVKLDYLADDNYKYSGELKNHTTYNLISNVDSACTSATLSDAYKYSCSGNECSKANTELKKCNNVEMTRYADQTFSIDGDLYRYVLKQSPYMNYSINASAYSNALYNGLNYIDIGHGNLPVSYSTSDGEKSISLEYSKLGHIKSSDTVTTVLDKILSEQSTDYNKWNCKYVVTSELIPPETNNSGIDVIYRPIDLVNPFPDIDGAGRNVGSNWCDGNICHNENNLIKAIITEYDMPSEPMYSFILTPSIIQQIRKYNSSNSYLDFNLKCEGQTGRACVSEFVTQMINGNLNNSSFNAQASGTCVYRSLARDNRASNFYSVCKRDYYY